MPKIWFVLEVDLKKCGPTWKKLGPGGPDQVWKNWDRGAGPSLKNLGPGGPDQVRKKNDRGDRTGTGTVTIVKFLLNHGGGATTSTGPASHDVKSSKDTPKFKAWGSNPFLHCWRGWAGHTFLRSRGFVPARLARCVSSRLNTAEFFNDFLLVTVIKSCTISHQLCVIAVNHLLVTVINSCTISHQLCVIAVNHLLVTVINSCTISHQLCVIAVISYW